MKRIFAILIIAISLASCERLMMPKPSGKLPSEIYEQLWTTLDEGYVYFKYRGIDWDTLHGEFRKKIEDTMTEEALFDTLTLMLDKMHDPSISLKSSFKEYYFIDTSTYLPNFNRKMLERTYWKGHRKTGPFIHKIIDSIGYVYYGSFKDEVKEEHLNIIIEELRLNNDSIKGVIFDIRDNAGGDIKNAYRLLERMGVDTTFTLSAVLYKSFYKRSKERDDFTDPETSYIEQVDKTKFPKQFILLTNRETKAEAALFAAGSQGYTNVKIFGDITGGQAGRIIGTELQNGWQLEFPGSYHTTNDDRNIEEGVVPDNIVNTTQADEALGKDAIIDAALKAIYDGE